MGLGLMHAWWTAPLALFVLLIVARGVDRMGVHPTAVEAYLGLLYGHLCRRRADFRLAGDAERVAAATEVAEQLEGLLRLYAGTGVAAPSWSDATSAPHGDWEFLLRRHSAQSAPSGVPIVNTSRSAAEQAKHASTARTIEEKPVEPTTPTMPTRLADLEDCQFATLDEVRRAVRERRAFLAVDRSFSLRWAELRGTNPRKAELVFGLIMSWSFVWAAALMIAFAWPSLGLSALLLALVSMVAFAVCRPWRAYWTWLLALALLIFGQGLPSWSGGMWLLSATLVCGYYEWCSDRFTERLLANEELLAQALASGRAVLKASAGNGVAPGGAAAA